MQTYAAAIFAERQPAEQPKLDVDWSQLSEAQILFEPVQVSDKPPVLIIEGQSIQMQPDPCPKPNRAPRYVAVVQLPPRSEAKYWYETGVWIIATLLLMPSAPDSSFLLLHVHVSRPLI